MRMCSIGPSSEVCFSIDAKQWRNSANVVRAKSNNLCVHCVRMRWVAAVVCGCCVGNDDVESCTGTQHEIQCARAHPPETPLPTRWRERSARWRERSARWRERSTRWRVCSIHCAGVCAQNEPSSIGNNGETELKFGAHAKV